MENLLMMIQKKVRLMSLIVNMVKRMMNVTNNLLKAKKYFNNNKNLISCVNHALLDFYLGQYIQLA